MLNSKMTKEEKLFFCWNYPFTILENSCEETAIGVYAVQRSSRQMFRLVSFFISASSRPIRESPINSLITLSPVLGSYGCLNKASQTRRLNNKWNLFFHSSRDCKFKIMAGLCFLWSLERKIFPCCLLLLVVPAIFGIPWFMYVTGISASVV